MRPGGSACGKWCGACVRQGAGACEGWPVRSAGDKFDAVLECESSVGGADRCLARLPNDAKAVRQLPGERINFLLAADIFDTGPTALPAFANAADWPKLQWRDFLPLPPLPFFPPPLGCFGGGVGPQ